MKSLRVWSPEPGRVPTDELDFLRELGGPCLLALKGRDPARTRAVSVMLHGNEPSGLRALHAFLLASTTPAVNVFCFVGAVEAALTAPFFHHRMLPGRTDLNRAFGPLGREPEHLVAREVVERIRAAKPEFAVDLHNNSGENPAYGVGPVSTPSCLAIVELFSKSFVYSPMRMGTFTEAMAGITEAVTIECGRMGDPAADALATRGLREFLLTERLPAEPKALLDIFVNPVRVLLHPKITLAFAESPRADADLTLTHDIDRHNFQSVPARTRLGWIRDGAPWPFEARSHSGEEISRRYFEIAGTELWTTRTLLPIMMTTSPVAAKADCLFYIVERR